MKSGEQIDQTFPPSLNEDEKAKILMMNEEATYYEDTMVDIPMELENEPITLEEEQEMSIIETSIGKHYDKAIRDAPYIEELT